MSRVKIFQSSTGDLYAFSEENELNQVKQFFGAGPETIDVMTRVDKDGAITHTRQDNPECWCRIFPSDHPNIPAPTCFGQKHNILPRKPRD